MLHHPYDLPTLKTKALCLVTNEGRLKRLLLLYEWLIQPYLSLLWLLLATHFVTRVTPIDDIDVKSHKTELKSSRNYSTYQSFKVKITPLVIYSLGSGHTHTHTHALPERSDFKKPGAQCGRRAWFKNCQWSKLLLQHSTTIVCITISLT